MSSDFDEEFSYEQTTTTPIDSMEFPEEEPGSGDQEPLPGSKKCYAIAVWFELKLNLKEMASRQYEEQNKSAYSFLQIFH